MRDEISFTMVRYINSIYRMVSTICCLYTIYYNLFKLNVHGSVHCINPLNAELNPICHLLALLGAHHILHVSRVRVNILAYNSN